MLKYITDELNDRVDLVGAKASNLRKLSRLDINVPGFICLSSVFLEDVLIQNGINLHAKTAEIHFDEEESIRKGSCDIGAIIMGAVLPDNFAEELIYYLEMKFPLGTRFSIRSSSLLEDGNNYTFAGQLDTFLNIDKEDVITHVLKCLASLYSARVLKYSHFNKIDVNSLKMGVIIQEMVLPETAGVLFTSNPQGLLNETVIINGKGTGDYIVEDKTDVTTYYYNKTDMNYYYETKGGSPVLENPMIELLMDTSYKIQEEFGEYLDIEYAIKAGEVYILQVRPITTIDDAKLVILDNSNIVESYPNITLPLTYTFIRTAYTGVFKNVTYLITKSNKVISGNQHVFKEMLGSVNGRVYYKISNWYSLIQFLPFSKKIIPIWQDMMGVKEKNISDVDMKVTFTRKIAIYANALFEFVRMPRSMKKLEKEFNGIRTYYHNAYHDNLSNEELIVIYNNLQSKLFCKWGITLFNDAYAFVYTGMVKNAFKRSGMENYEEETNRYISNISNIESMKPIRELIRICNIIQSENKLAELLNLKSEEDTIQYLSTEGNIQNELRNYIDIYGDRSLEELKLESKTFRSSPILLIDKILEYTGDPAKLEKITVSFCDTSSNAIIKSKFGFFKRKWINMLSKRAMIGIQNREISRLNRSRIYGMVRTIFLTIAKNLKQENQIDAVEDIFYLEVEEVFNHIKTGNVDLKAVILERKREFDVYQKLPVYSRLIFMNQEWNKTHQNVNSVMIDEDIHKMMGTPCSNGIVTGEVVVIHNPNDAKDIKDKILVTKMTDPGWVFLLTIAKGIITEKGSLLSHTAIISRELKIPSIVGVAKATKVLKTGDVVKMDGSTGIIEKVSEENVSCYRI